jgi:hypothetical protein
VYTLLYDYFIQILMPVIVVVVPSILAILQLGTFHL